MSQTDLICDNQSRLGLCLIILHMRCTKLTSQLEGYYITNLRKLHHKSEEVTSRI